MPLSQRLDFHVGNSFFRNPWIPSPASTSARDGLGPLYNTNACQNCHIKDGRGHLPQADGDNRVSLLLRLSRAAKTVEEKLKQTQSGPLDVSNYGKQLQDFALPGVPAEGHIDISWTSETVRFSDGDTINLRKPKFSISNPGYGPLPVDLEMSARIAPAMIGLGLLAAIDERTLKNWSDPEDLDGDGISGKRNKVYEIKSNSLVTGRFGWKAGQANLRQQNAAAFHGDMGLTSSLFPHINCERNQTQCFRAFTEKGLEVSDKILDAVTFYTQNLAVPVTSRSLGKAQITKRGRQLFDDAGCVSCHKPEVQTGKSEWPWLESRFIRPYTDLLVHDMGEGLADGRAEFAATGREWRTAPLWGIGLSQAVDARTSFLHDGRARTLMEAIVWHGGEAQLARDQVLTMNSTQRHALITFIQSL